MSSRSPFRRLPSPATSSREGIAVTADLTSSCSTSDVRPARRGLAARTTTRLATGVVAAAAGALLLSNAGPAAAASHVVSDPAGDVSAIRLADTADGDGPPKPVADRHHRRGDILSVRTSYDGRTVTLATRLRSTGQATQIAAEIKVPGHKGRFGVMASIGGSHTAASLFTSLDDEIAMTCDGLSARTKRRQATVVVKVPASCLGTPAWVRTALATTSAHMPSPAELAWPDAFEDVALFFDVAGMSGMSAEWFESRTTTLPLGPKVRRG
jgi:hypothetical protein